MTLAQARKKMGCALQWAGGKTAIATYGEFSTKEGGAHMKVLLRVPAALIVEAQPGLAGPDSKAQGRSDGTKEADKKDGYWYGPTSPGLGWKVIALEPDTKRTAK
jgi:hypothetical protein